MSFPVRYLNQMKVYCLNCGKPFKRRRYSVPNRLPKGVRTVNTTTCTPECSRKLQFRIHFGDNRHDKLR